mgnify:CR=1 FL=1
MPEVLLDEIGIEMARSEVSYSVDEALSIADRLGYPVVLRPASVMMVAGLEFTRTISYPRFRSAFTACVPE